MIEVLPAIIPESYEDLSYKMSLVKNFVKLVQMDVCDGKFVPSKCWPYVGDDENHFEKITEEDEGFPFWQNMDFEADLMIKNPEGHTLADFIQFMGIKKIGYQGQPFDEEVLKKIKDLRKKYPDITISVDGGVSFDNYKDLAKAGANKLISGSALYESENIKEAWEEMEKA